VHEKRVYHALNGVRGIAALAVLLHHARTLIGDVSVSGYMAVDLFFLLSGFVVAHAYEERLKGGLTAWKFIKLRLLRFYPLYLVGILLGGAWMVAEMVLARLRC
jgi:peptidoglycan/LPS O-acetylase OafA/YrhL